ncbi:class I SAM-dependent RNA methyltransferase [Candidatus Hydrogenedentota bacterium]
MPDTKQIEITALSHGGDGVGRIEREVCFVPYSAPGDVLSIRTTGKRHGVARGEIAEVQRPSEHRREPICSHFTRCGGCDWLHIDYDFQRKWKKRIVSETVARIGGIKGVDVDDVREDSQELRYRNRARFHLGRRSGQVVAGFVAALSHDIVNIDDCPLLCESLVDTFRKVKDIAGRFKAPLPREIEITVSPKGEALCWLPAGRKRDFRHAGFGRRLASECKEMLVNWAGDKRKRRHFDMECRGYVARVVNGCFSQASFCHNEILVASVLESAGELNGARVFEFFCGSGNFSWPLAARGARITGVDFDKQAIAAARRTPAPPGSQLPKFLSSRLDAQCTFNMTEKTADLVLLDPPRKGAKELMPDLTSDLCDRILYVSCDPGTLARDLGTLAKAGRHVSRIQLVDMSPNTCHIETVSLIE